MSKAKKDVNPIDVTEKITLYAPESAPHHRAGEEVKIHPTQKGKFLGLGFTEGPYVKKEDKKGKKE